MTTMVEDTRAITGGVDTHADLHVAAAQQIWAHRSTG
jgi:hypothetical protein